MMMCSRSGFISSHLWSHWRWYFPVYRNLWSTSRLSKNSRVEYNRIWKKSIRKILLANTNVHIWILIANFPRYEVNFFEKLQSYCANINFAEKSRYDRIFQQVTHKGGESAMNYIKISQNAQALPVSVGKNYSEDQLMHIFLDSFHQGGNILLK